MKQELKILLLLLGDIIILYLSLFIALKIRYLNSFDIAIFKTHFWPFSIVFLFLIFIFYIFDLYNLRLSKNNLEFYKNSLTTIILSLTTSIIFFYTFPFFGIAPKTNLLIFSFIFTLLFYTWRLIFNKTLISLPIQSILIIGENSDTKEFSDFIFNHSQFGYKISTFLNSAAPDENLIKKVDIILSAPSINNNFILSSKIFENLFLKVNFFYFADFYEKITHRLPLNSLEYGWMLENFKIKHKAYDILKRIFDIIFSLLFLAIFSPLFIIIALIIGTINGLPVFYKQERVGKNEKIFQLIKFRTMKKDAEKNGARFASSNDDRVTLTGRFLRNLYLDELPQLLNILKSDMSFVGPRPERPEFIKEFSQKLAFYNLRHLIKPGITGWAQLNYLYADSLETTKQKLSYDLYYLKNRSLVLDLLLIIKTLKNILLRKGQ